MSTAKPSAATGYNQNIIRHIITQTFEKFESSTSCIESRIVHRSIFTHSLATAVTIHAMSSVYFLCHFGTCCQSCVCSFLYMHFISEGSYSTRATLQFDSCGHVAHALPLGDGDTSTTCGGLRTCNSAVTLLILRPPASCKLLRSYRKTHYRYGDYRIEP